MSKLRRTVAVVAATFAVVLLVGWRILRHLVPCGASTLPFVFASVENASIRAPGGMCVMVVYNDAGAAHSGNHWTWMVTESWVWGKSVVGEGYCLPKRVMCGASPVVGWADESTARVMMVPSQYSSEEREVLIPVH
jgi:hypothetical protein